MTDIVERLRACDCGAHCKAGCIQEKAADEIERLRAALQDIAIGVGENVLSHDAMRARAFDGLK